MWRKIHLCEKMNEHCGLCLRWAALVLVTWAARWVLGHSQSAQAWSWACMNVTYAGKSKWNGRDTHQMWRRVLVAINPRSYSSPRPRVPLPDVSAFHVNGNNSDLRSDSSHGKHRRRHERLHNLRTNAFQQAVLCTTSVMIRPHAL